MEEEEKRDEAPVLTEEQRARVRAFIAELRSGRRQQGRNYLADRYDRFCCLGVACEMAMPHIEGMRKELGEGCYTYRTLLPLPDPAPWSIGADTKDSHVALPFEVRLWYGLEQRDPTLKVPAALIAKYGRVCTSEDVQLADVFEVVASELNDRIRMDLSEIADCFEYTYLRDEWEARNGEVPAS